MPDFYHSVVSRLIKTGRIKGDARVLVVCGEQLDAEVLRRAGLRDLVVSNTDTRHQQTVKGEGVHWEHQDAEALTYADGAFDLVVVHHGLHHCRQPHRALCEMYRVARCGVLVFEPCDNVLTRLGQRLGVGQSYEVHAVAAHGLQSGGVNNTAVPNYVHRWGPGEVERTLKAYAPEYAFQADVWYHLEIHWHDLKAKRNKVPLCLAAAAWPLLWLLTRFGPGWANTMATFVEKPGRLHPWLRETEEQGPAPDPDWFAQHIPSSDGNDQP
jgi:SAM-dependent methyltransferase